jgi:predicted acetyltransferase
MEKVMNVTIEEITIDEKEILRNLLEKYNYEFSQYENHDINKLGLYGYPYLDYYWTEKNRFSFFIKVNNNLAGFMMINEDQEYNIKVNYIISEFFILYKYRRRGIGKYAVNYILNKFKGKWQLKYHPKNIVSEKFWINVINNYTEGKYEVIKNNINAKYTDGTIGNIILFEI